MSKMMLEKHLYLCNEIKDQTKEFLNWWYFVFNTFCCVLLQYGYSFPCIPLNATCSERFTLWFGLISLSDSCIYGIKGYNYQEKSIIILRISYQRVNTNSEN